MAINNFIPTIWSEHLYRELGTKYIAAAHCTREYEGEIKAKGNKVKIAGVGSVNINNYTKNTNLSAPQTLSDLACELVIDQAKCFNFQLDDVDHAQANPKLLSAAMQNAADGLANAADQYIFSLYDQAGFNVDYTSRDVGGIRNAMLRARGLLFRSNVHSADDIVLEVSPEVAMILMREQEALNQENINGIDTGCIGRLYGVKVYVSNNVAVDYDVPSGDDLPTSFHKCIMRTKRAIAYAEQISEIEAYRPELRFADAVKGLHLYGAKVVYPNEMVLVNIGIFEEEEA